MIFTAVTKSKATFSGKINSELGGNVLLNEEYIYIFLAI